uniref:Uncharacterized protein n=1 Tax=Nitratidesulfovibrio vulgaris TaxID=881 RepID=Q46603_NITVL|nr:hypothetical protein [Desulfovibrio vulgaris] [Nitratidesulfovibrio vulgaris str. 'Miyazaki F']
MTVGLAANPQANPPDRHARYARLADPAGPASRSLPPDWPGRAA